LEADIAASKGNAPQDFPLTVMRFAFRLYLCTLRYGDSEYPVGESSVDVVIFVLDFKTEKDAPFKSAIKSFGEFPGLVLGFGSLFAAQRQDAILEQHLDIFLVHTGYLSCDLNVLFGIRYFHAGPISGLKLMSHYWPAVETAKNFIEQPVDVAMK
jgi:hypothetical protein